MSYQVLARKWRPHAFSELVGQEHVVRALSNALDNERVHHAYLFTGTRGVGKTTLARILAKSLNCETGVSSTPCGVCNSCREIDEGRFVDLIEVDAASRTKVDQTRELLENVPYAPVAGRYKVYLIDEVHMFSDSSFNALLKTLEEPPPHVKFLLATTDPQKVPITVLSRCLQFNLKRLPLDQISGQLKHILESEKIYSEANALSLLAMAADGSMRDALSLMDQAIVFGAGQVREDDVRSMLGTVPADYVANLLQALSENDADAVIDHVTEMAKKSVNFVELLKTVLIWLHRIALLQHTRIDEFEDGMDLERLRSFAANLSPEDVQLYYQMALVGQADLNLAPEPRIGFEMLMLRMLAFQPDDVQSSAAPVTNKASTSVGRPQVQNKVPSTSADSAAPKTGSSSESENSPSETVSVTSREWPVVVQQLQLKAMTAQFAGHCAIKSWQDNHLILALDPDKAPLQNTAAPQKLIDALKAAIDGIKVDIVVEATTTDTPEQLKAEQARQIQSSAEDDIMNNPYVQGMRETFGAEVITDSIKST